nr:cell adhesion molecule Dscam2-like [Cherax quadricarinatus]
MLIRVERAAPVSVHLTPRVVVVDAGGVGMMRCQVGGSRPHSITWYKDGHVITPAGRIAITEGGAVLEVRGVSKADAGMYQCFVREDQETIQDSAELRLGASPPELEYKFISQTITPGPSVSLKCIASGTPTPTISWALDGFPLPQNERLVVGQYVSVHGQVISHVNISGVRVEDGGSYSCTASNTAASVLHAAPLHVYGRPLVRSMSPMSAVAGETFTVRCPVAGYPISSTTWSKGGRTLPINRRQRVSPEGELSITQVSRVADEGSYTCTASNKQGHTSSQDLQLRVVEPPRLAPFTMPESLWAGSRVAVQCLVVQGDPPVTLTWLHNGNPATATPGVIVMPLGQFVLALFIERLQPQHSGNYTCQASTPSATASHSGTLSVHVPPSIKPFDFGSLVSGMRTAVTCDVQMGDPPMTLLWLYEGHVLTPTADLQLSQHDSFSSSLVLTHVRPHHAGNYTCVARNEAREVRYTAQLLVRVTVISNLLRKISGVVFPVLRESVWTLAATRFERSVWTLAATRFERVRLDSGSCQLPGLREFVWTWLPGLREAVWTLAATRFERARLDLAAARFERVRLDSGSARFERVRLDLAAPRFERSRLDSGSYQVLRESVWTLAAQVLREFVWTLAAARFERSRLDSGSYQV